MLQILTILMFGGIDWIFTDKHLLSYVLSSKYLLVRNFRLLKLLRILCTQSCPDTIMGLASNTYVSLAFLKLYLEELPLFVSVSTLDRDVKGNLKE